MKPYIPERLPLESAWDWPTLVPLIADANFYLARYSGTLRGMVNPAVLLSPLSSQEAVISSRIEGTITSLDEVLKYEADIEPESDQKRFDIQEVLNYRSAMHNAFSWLSDKPLNLALVRAIHAELMQGVRGKDKTPGAFRKEQNWIGPRGCSMDQATYVPPEPLIVKSYMEDLQDYFSHQEADPLLQTAIIHAQFEIIHPFLDGNGRAGRILIPLFLCHKQRLDYPMFYISAYFERNREEYSSKLLEITRSKDWEGWIRFFLRAVIEQAKSNDQKALSILNLYERMKAEIPAILKSQFTMQVIETIFSSPIFNTTVFIAKSGIQKQSSNRLLKILKENEILKIVRAGKPRKPEVLVFPALLDIVEH
ncbi:MAG: Fic family protein [Anaerolineales bacterium]|nr:Fic family protein [Anaerolineales bacterium]